MAGITIAQAQAKLDGWMSADDAVQGGQGYTMGTRTLTRANAQEIRDNIIFWEKKVIQLTNGGGIAAFEVTPL